MTDEKKNSNDDQLARADEEAARAAAAADEAVEAAPESPEAVEAVEAAEVAAEAAEEAAKAPKAKRAAKARKAEQAADEAEDAAEEAVAAEAKPKPKRSRAKKAEPVAAETEAEAPAEEAEPVAEEAAEAEPVAEPKPKRRTRTKQADDEAAERQEAARPAAAPAPSRRRNGEVPAGVEVRAQAKYVRTSARKARLVCDHIRGKDVAEARAILAFTPRAAAKDWAKLLESAVANAEHNHELVGDDLRIAAVYADEGPTLKRYRPRAMGRATRIRKRTSHLTITLTPKEG